MLGTLSHQSNEVRIATGIYVPVRTRIGLALLPHAHKTRVDLLSIPSNMKLHLILLASLFHLSNGFEVALRGKYTEEPCSGEEYPDLEQCVMRGVTSNPSLADVWPDHFEGGGFMNSGGVRKLQTNGCGACTGDEPRGSFCIVFCGAGRGSRRRLSDDGTDDVAVFEDGAYKGNSKAADIAKAIIECLGNVSSTNDLCLPDTANMALTVTL
jgi:hypothetical protein